MIFYEIDSKMIISAPDLVQNPIIGKMGRLKLPKKIHKKYVLCN
jgi:hypothetical protein